ncbi:hypothetical protein H0H87_005589 [Tephrocybe sp. NHM501043]|nr:hypothetical protein H0H87_005589 [Tephrocybe sp. NHM501043]
MDHDLPPMGEPMDTDEDILMGEEEIEKSYMQSTIPSLLQRLGRATPSPFFSDLFPSPPTSPLPRKKARCSTLPFQLVPTPTEPAECQPLPFPPTTTFPPLLLATAVLERKAPTPDEIARCPYPELVYGVPPPPLVPPPSPTPKFYDHNGSRIPLIDFLCPSSSKNARIPRRTRRITKQPTIDADDGRNLSQAPRKRTRGVDDNTSELRCSLASTRPLKRTRINEPIWVDLYHQTELGWKKSAQCKRTRLQDEEDNDNQELHCPLQDTRPTKRLKGAAIEAIAVVTDVSKKMVLTASLAVLDAVFSISHSVSLSGGSRKRRKSKDTEMKMMKVDEREAQQDERKMPGAFLE